jgi:hypothetical protein
VYIYMYIYMYIYVANRVEDMPHQGNIALGGQGMWRACQFIKCRRQGAAAREKEEGREGY